MIQYAEEKMEKAKRRDRVEETGCTRRWKIKGLEGRSKDLKEWQNHKTKLVL